MVRRKPLAARLWSRAEFFKAGGGLVAAASLASCGLLDTQPAEEGAERTGTGRRKGKEAPTLADRVKAGELPPVEERLPPEPMVVEPVDDVGVYGGQWNTMINGPEDSTWLDRTVGYEALVRWNPDFTDVIPNIVESFESNEDGTEHTLRIRPGIRWSDGEPFTVDDIVFAQNDVDGHPELGGEARRAEKVDEHTVTIIEPEPNSLLIQELATGGGQYLVEHPKHYLAQFHPDHNPDADAEAKDANADSWIEYFEQKTETWLNPELPTLNGWILVGAESGDERIVVERNPYYWKVDTEGSQLPYIDRVEFTVVEDTEAMVLRIANGEVDMHARHVNTPDNKPVIARHREDAGYELFEAPSSNMNTMVIALNVTTPDEVRREIFTNLDFRIGLSHAINRPEIIDTVYQRQGEPWQAAPRPESELYHERLASQYTEYDVDLANEHLDRAGYVDRDGDGFRLGPDGKRISFPVSVKSEEVQMVTSLDLVKRYWEAVGVEVHVNAIDASLKFTRELANEHFATTHTGDGGWNDAWLDPRWYLPMNAAESKFAIPWALWYHSDGAEGEAPPDDTEAGRAAREQIDLYRQVQASTDEDERLELMTSILDIAADMFWAIGIALPEGGYGIVKKTFHNVPASMPNSWIYPTPGPTNPEQYYISST